MSMYIYAYCVLCAERHGLEFFNMPVILTALHLFSALKVLWVEEILGSTGERSS